MQDSLGFTLDESAAFTTPPGVIIYGPPGIGKTTSIAQAFQNALYLCSKPNILAPYGSWWDDQKAKGNKDILKYRPYDPRAGALPPLARYDVSKGAATAKGLSTRNFLGAILSRIAEGAIKGVRPYTTVVMDEMTDISNRVLLDFQSDPALSGKGGKTDGWAVAAALKEWHRNLMSFPSVTGIAMVTVCHSREPSYFGTQDQKIATDKRGALQYKGGPSYAYGSLVEPMCADADFVIQLLPESDGLGPTKRYMFTEVDELWARKARDFRIPAKVEMTEASLQKLLQGINLKF